LNKSNRVLFLLFIGWSLFNFAACSYSFTGASVPAHLKSIAIPVFADRSGSGEFNLGQKLTTQVTQKFIDDNTLFVGDRVNSNSSLEGTIVSLSDAPSVVSGGEKITTRRITITVTAVFKDLVKKQQVFERNFSNYGDYSVGSADVTIARKTAIEDAINKIAEDILLGVVSNW
jgi:hypothetical protein